MNRFKKGARVKYVGSVFKSSLRGRHGTVLSQDAVGDTQVYFDGDPRTFMIAAFNLEPVVETTAHRNVLPTDAGVRNSMPMADGLLWYFPNALAAVAKLSKVANEQHNPGEPMHWARQKSTDHANKIVKHLVDAGGIDSDGQPHSAKVAWRALALLEDELIAAGAVPGRNAKGTPEVLPKQHRRVATPAERRAYGIPPHNCIEDEV